MYKTAIIFVGAIVVCSGCETITGQQRRQNEMRFQGELGNLRASVQRLDARLDGIEAGREDLYAQIADLRSTQDRASNQQDAALQAIEQKLSLQSAAQERASKEMVDTLTKKLAAIVKTNAAPASSVRTESGYEHVVKAGQTLSEIAKAYGVTASVISKANKLKNPDDLRVGQTLFIPE